MVLTKDELIRALQNEIRILLHLASKVDPAKLDYRPGAQQRSTLELLQYLVIMGPIHLRGTLAAEFDMQAFGNQWRAEETVAKAMNLEQTKEAIGKQPALFAELLGSLSEADLRAEINMFGTNASRGSMIVNLVLCHFSAYRMQLFLYLKQSGQEQLNTMNLWVGVDGAMQAA